MSRRLPRVMCRLVAVPCVVVVISLFSDPAHAEVRRDRFNAGGYFRVMTRPDFEGGSARLGLSNLNGRLLNEGPWAALELGLDVLQATAGTQEVWAHVHGKIEGGSVFNADAGRGNLGFFNLTQLYVQAGNIFFENVTWQLGTLDSYFGDLGLYDFKLAQIFFDTLGLSGRYRDETIDLLLGVGDAGFFTRGSDYSTLLTGGGSLRLTLGPHLQIGAGAQAYFEPATRGNRFAPHRTPAPPGIDPAELYEHWVRGDIAETYLAENPGREDAFPNPEPVGGNSYKLIAHVGTGNLGPLSWLNVFASYQLRHPDTSSRETFAGRDYTIYLHDLTDERTSLQIGAEAYLQLVPQLLDAVLAGYFSDNHNGDNRVKPGFDQVQAWSTVLRVQLYLTDTVHLLVESSFAQEKSKLGNLWREHYDSIFAGGELGTDSEGLEYGDTDLKTTWQLKAGVVLNPLGPGIYTRPSLRLLFGMQRSNVHAAYSTSFSDSLAAFDEFAETRDRHWHFLVALEAEGWF